MFIIVLIAVISMTFSYVFINNLYRIKEKTGAAAPVHSVILFCRTP